MTRARWVRWGGLALLGVLAALLATFNSRERVALNLGFVSIYQIPLVPLLFGAFLAGMAAMFLLGLAHDLRVRRALRDAGFGEPIAAPEPRLLADSHRMREAREEEIFSGREEPALLDDEGPPPPETEPPPRSPP
jgi:uncharacterized integral membrane protein